MAKKKRSWASKNYIHASQNDRNYHHSIEYGEGSAKRYKKVAVYVLLVTFVVSLFIVVLAAA